MTGALPTVGLEKTISASERDVSSVRWSVEQPVGSEPERATVALATHLLFASDGHLSRTAASYLLCADSSERAPEWPSSTWARGTGPRAGEERDRLNDVGSALLSRYGAYVGASARTVSRTELTARWSGRSSSVALPASCWQAAGAHNAAAREADARVAERNGREGAQPSVGR